METPTAPIENEQKLLNWFEEEVTSSGLGKTYNEVFGFLISDSFRSCRSAVAKKLLPHINLILSKKQESEEQADFQELKKEMKDLFEPVVEKLSSGLKEARLGDTSNSTSVRGNLDKIAENMVERIFIETIDLQGRLRKIFGDFSETFEIPVKGEGEEPDPAED